MQHPLGALAHALLLLHLATEMLRDLVGGNGAADKVLERGILRVERGILRVERGVLIRRGGGDEQPQCGDHEVLVMHSTVAVLKDACSGRRRYSGLEL